MVGVSSWDRGPFVTFPVEKTTAKSTTPPIPQMLFVWRRNSDKNYKKKSLPASELIMKLARHGMILFNYANRFT